MKRYYIVSTKFISYYQSSTTYKATIKFKSEDGMVYKDVECEKEVHGAIKKGDYVQIENGQITGLITKEERSLMDYNFGHKKVIFEK